LKTSLAPHFVERLNVESFKENSFILKGDSTSVQDLELHYCQRHDIQVQHMGRKLQQQCSEISTLCLRDADQLDLLGCLPLGWAWAENQPQFWRIRCLSTSTWETVVAFGELQAGCTIHFYCIYSGVSHTGCFVFFHSG
jgi:hypothetical protein